ncbi:hypothetical protein CL65_gp054 [Mycobacterium phage Patience]|uniref:Uncharacterized protein n=1 Tax=Mycobacterium phage Patience TaxID=1074308 RepID=G1JWG4_9CAUD|nr:hypothetical protein CL65_gp054 [Mycobacterium phage Patience]AEL97962.2 hypothetical protein PATIENCE_53 [Mycobacterium phage Patience]
MFLETVNEETGEIVKEGDAVRDFRGEVYTFVQATRPRIPGKTGKVVVRACDAVQFAYGTQWNRNDENPTREYYDKVFGLSVREVDDGEPMPESIPAPGAEPFTRLT